MMGAHHAVCGAAAWLAVSTKLHIDLTAVTAQFPAGPVVFDVGLGLLQLSPVGVLAGALVTAGAALVPDADHHDATIAHSLPPVSNAVCAGMGAVAGGHRHGTHSILGILAFTALAWFVGLWTYPVPGFGHVNVGSGALTVLLIAFAAKALRIIPDDMRRAPWVAGTIVGGFVALYAPAEQWWLPLAMGIGVIVHIAGDMLTIGGVNLLWPFTIKPPTRLSEIPVVSWMWKPNGYLAIPILGKAGSFREWVLLVPLSLYAIYGMATTIPGVAQTFLGQLNTVLQALLAR
jgi:membrane-bound metal-dependent hydrolase YbcI (DUF457 family)